MASLLWVQQWWLVRVATLLRVQLRQLAKAATLLWVQWRWLARAAAEAGRRPLAAALQWPCLLALLESIGDCLLALEDLVLNSSAVASPPEGLCRARSLRKLDLNLQALLLENIRDDCPAPEELPEGLVTRADRDRRCG